MSDQIILSSTLIALLCLFIWGKVRYDALAVGALFVLVVLEIIPANEAFAGFAHPAVITVALVLIISQGLTNSGIAGLVGKLIGGREFTEIQFMVSLLFIAAILSSFINNIGALAILLPITLNICQKIDQKLITMLIDKKLLRIQKKVGYYLPPKLPLNMLIILGIY